MRLSFGNLFGRKPSAAIPAEPAEGFDAQMAAAAAALSGGQPERALQMYDAIIERQPELAVARYKRANALNMLGQWQRALAGYDDAISLDPGYANAHCNRGTVLEKLERWDEALASYDRTLALNEGDFFAHYNRAAVLRKKELREQALAAYDRAIALKGDYLEALVNRANLLHELQRHEPALASLDQALAISPDMPEALHARGASLLALRRLPQARASYERAIEVKPGYVEAHVNLGNLLQEMLQPETALASYDRAIELDPTHAHAWLGRGAAQLKLRQTVAAIESYRRALVLKPELDILLGERRYAQSQLCDWAGYEEDCRRIQAGLEAGQGTCMPLQALALFHSAALQRLAAEIWARQRCPADDALGPVAIRAGSGRIRVGYFSPDFRVHPVSLLAAELFETHNRDRFEITAFAFGSDADDPLRARLRKTFDHFIDVNNLSDIEVARLARERSIDIAVDLGGYTEHARTGVFALRAAPVQVSYLGYPGTSGTPYIDYLVADRRLVPDGSEQYYSEQIIFLPESYQPNDSRRPIATRVFTREELGLPAEGFIFYCFNRTFKLTPATFAGWMRILQQVEGSVLWLSEAEAVTAANLRQAARQAGVDPDRLVFAARMPSMAEHLARQRAADLFLDTMPFNAHTTASDALRAGLPVLTCAGESLASRVAASLLFAVGLPELISSSQAEYEALAIHLATDPAAIGSLRRKLAQNLPTAPLFDTPRYARALESAFELVHRRVCAGLPAEHVMVLP